MIAGVLAALALAAAAPSHIAFAADRAPATYGEIYRVAANGAVTNLSRSPAADRFPAASPDGRHVAFLRIRAHSVRLYVVGSDGRGVVAVSPAIAGEGSFASVRWAPDSRRFAVVLTFGGAAGALYVGELGGGWRRVARAVAQTPPAWSFDSTRLAYVTPAALVRVISPAGRRLWSTTGEGAPAWSRSGLLAVHANSDAISIVDAAGRSRARFGGEGFAWSGDRLASVHDGILELRAGGLGPPTVRTRVAPRSPGCDCSVVWAGSDSVRVRTGNWVGYDVARRRKLPAVTFGAVWSTDGLAAYTKLAGPTASLVRGNETVRTAASCNSDEPFESLQFVGRTTSLVYQSGCATPSEDVYSVTPDGTTVQQLTKTPTDEFAPALSPDGTHVVYSRQLLATFCNGCPHELVVSPGTQLTTHSFDDAAPFDDDASFSPDGTQVAFARSGASTPYELYTVPTAGGPVHDLGVGGTHPVWGPARIAFLQSGRTDYSIRTLDPATGALTTVAKVDFRLHDVGALAWSPDGRLAYLALDPRGGAAIVVIGGRTIPLAKTRVSGLAWSPDGSRFAFVAPDANGYGEVWTIGADGTGARQVTRNLGVVGTLSWR
jgi:dipeptidyl aminopeptidase/acylaminoacyl peptidase